MLGIGFKLSDTSTTSLCSSLGEFLSREYASNMDKGQTDTHQIALNQFIQLKTDVDLVRTPSAISRHVLLRYYAQLEKMTKRFPCNGDASSTHTSLQLQFTWNDSFCVQTDRSTAEGLKMACHHFMRAAGAFTEVKDKIVERTLGVRTPDMSAEGLGLLTYLMLAQAQACFYEKAIKDQMKDAVKAMLVQQALDYYVSALECYRSSALAGAIDRSWGVHLEFQVHCMRAATQYWQGTASKTAALDRGEGYGEEIARLFAADAACNEACKVATQNKLPTLLLQSAQALQRVVREHLDAAKKDNASVYLEKVPNFSDLPVVGKAAMVKPLPFTTDELQQELGEVDVFEQFVPKDLLLRADSVKQEIKVILEQTADKTSKSNEAAKERLRSMGLPASIEAFETTSDKGIPPAIWQRIQYVKVTTASALVGTSRLKQNSVVAFIQQQLQDNQSMSADAERRLHLTESRLSQEEVEDNMCRQNYGEKWARSPSSLLNQNFRADIDRYYRLVKEAKTSDGIVREKLNENQDNMEALSRSKRSLDQELPELQQDNCSCKEEIARVSLLLLRLGQLVEEKHQVLCSFRGLFDKFDALPTLLSGKNADAISIDTALEDEKQFFRNHFEEKIATICEEEQNVLSDLVEANTHFEAKKDTDHVLRKRQAFLQRLSDAVDVFEQLESHVKEGAKFYGELSSRIAQLHQTVEDHCSARELEKRELEMNLTADEELRQREIEDAALAQQMMEDMTIGNAATVSSANDEALARQLAEGTPQYYQPSQQQLVPPFYDHTGLQSQQQQQHSFAHNQPIQDPAQPLSNGRGSISSAPPLAYGGVYNQPQQEHSLQSNIYRYPGQQQQYGQLFPLGPSGGSVNE
ncbi:unnamed protein product [Peronospora belbahrii]|uniref:BRO1 domain-containing protein n=1 Tax=Peronospora belbahrii TaxID=622444 RepID=A0AAU9KT19_9STRA|nr:unnamed protein product [Peronospora belbahrii]